MPARLRPLLFALLLLPAALPARAQELRIAYDPAAGYRPVVRVGPVLRGTELESVAQSGVPVRVRIRVELWKDRLFDALVDSVTWSSTIGYEPIEQLYFVRALPAGTLRRFSNYAAVRQALETEYPLHIRPREPGRFYYTVSLQIETLSVSDLNELERWLQGELQPAVSGQRSVPGAVGAGARRLMLRLLDLPARRIDHRTGSFNFAG
ncbi:MAG TPA: hypothetical protein VLC53_01925 [Myxococcota bacterium]|nr:hypothetical protein [Myxococcota bacterium]